jgi:RHS repeat-associated protein
VRYLYDALGRRIAKLAQAVVPVRPSAGSGWQEHERTRINAERGYGLTLYGWEGDTLAYETSERDKTTTHYVYEPGSFTPLMQAKAAAGVMLDDSVTKVQPIRAAAYYHCDQIGTPQELTDSDGELAWSAKYRAWGEAKEAISEAARKAGIGNPLRFAGQYHDAETGLHYNRHRYYDPSTGRFISKDPIGLEGGLNAFQYAPNPTGWIDPLGLTVTIPPTITASDITNKTRTEIRNLARQKGLVLARSDATGAPIKWKCPCTGKERLRLDRGHTDPSTGLAYNDRKAAVDHVHAYDSTGRVKVVSPDDGNPHFPTTGE